MNRKDMVLPHHEQSLKYLSAASKPAPFRIISLGWAADSESGIGILYPSEDTIEKELHDRYRSECAWLPVKLEHAMEEASTMAILCQGDSEAAKADVERNLLARGMGVSLWLLSATRFEQWQDSWNKHFNALEHWLESGGAAAYKAIPDDPFIRQFWSIFEEPPVIEIPLSVEVLTANISRKVAADVWQVIVKTMGACKANS